MRYIVSLASFYNECFTIYLQFFSREWIWLRVKAPSSLSLSLLSSSSPSALSSRLRDISNYTTVFACRTTRLVVRMHGLRVASPRALTRLEDSDENDDSTPESLRLRESILWLFFSFPFFARL